MDTMTGTAFLDEVAARLPSLRVLTDPVDLDGYRRDETAYLEPPLPLAVALPKRSAIAPQIPTVAELGFGAIEADLWYGLVAPAGTPREAIERLNREITLVLQREHIQEKLKASTVEARTSTPEQFGAYMQSEIARYGKLVRQFGLKVD